MGCGGSTASGNRAAGSRYKEIEKNEAANPKRRDSKGHATEVLVQPAPGSRRQSAASGGPPAATPGDPATADPAPAAADPAATGPTTAGGDGATPAGGDGPTTASGNGRWGLLKGKLGDLEGAAILLQARWRGHAGRKAAGRRRGGAGGMGDGLTCAIAAKRHAEKEEEKEFLGTCAQPADGGDEAPFGGAAAPDPDRADKVKRQSWANPFAAEEADGDGDKSELAKNKWASLRKKVGREEAAATAMQTMWRGKRDRGKARGRRGVAAGAVDGIAMAVAVARQEEKEFLGTAHRQSTDAAAADPAPDVPAFKRASAAEAGGGFCADDSPRAADAAAASKRSSGGVFGGGGGGGDAAFCKSDSDAFCGGGGGGGGGGGDGFCAGGDSQKREGTTDSNMVVRPTAFCTEEEKKKGWDTVAEKLGEKGATLIQKLWRGKQGRKQVRRRRGVEGGVGDGLAIAVAVKKHQEAETKRRWEALREKHGKQEAGAMLLQSRFRGMRARRGVISGDVTSGVQIAVAAGRHEKKKQAEGEGGDSTTA